MKSISDKDLQIFSRQLILKEFDEKKFFSLKTKKITIIGMGGIGCPLAQYLVRTGIINLTIIDYDNVNLSNLNRQILYDLKDVGEKKVNVAKKKLDFFNNNLKIITIPYKVNKKNISNYLSSSSLVIDATDNWKTMSLINRYCVQNSIPLLSCSVIGFDGQITLFQNSRNEHLCLNCIYPIQKEPKLPRCETVGILGTTAGITGLIAAQLTINYLLNNLENVGKIIMIDSKTIKFEIIKAKKNEGCPCINLLY